MWKQNWVENGKISFYVCLEKINPLEFKLGPTEWKYLLIK